jgi:HIV Tat-specific factor 1
MIAINPVDQLPKIKLYSDEDGQPKGDCSICFHSEQSVETAVNFLDEGVMMNDDTF